LQEVAFPENSLGIAQGTVTALLTFGGAAAGHLGQERHPSF